MKRPDDLKIKLCNDEPSRVHGEGLIYMLSPTGSALSTLRAMWDMSYEQVIAKIANEAVLEEERFILDGRYVKPHRRIVPCEADYV